MKEEQQQTLEQWSALRKEAGVLIDPETAEVDWDYGVVGDPYDIGRIPVDQKCTGRRYFAKSSGCDVWVAFSDLPRVTRNALWTKRESMLAFPAGIPAHILGGTES